MMARDPRLSPLREAYNLMHRGDDADVLEQAAEVIRRRSRRPDGLMARILLKVLEDTATNIRRGKL